MRWSSCGAPSRERLHCKNDVAMRSGHIPALGHDFSGSRVAEAGFHDVEETGIFVTVFAVLRLVCGVKGV